jgi:hypothetical protein
MLTQATFIAAYGDKLVTETTWAKDYDKLQSFLASVRNTLTGSRATWNHDGEWATAAWRSLGGKGKPTLKALRVLPPT